MNHARCGYRAYWHIFLFTGLITLLPASSAANQFGAQIKNAELTLQGNSYVLSAEFAYQLSNRAKEALENGVPLFWDIVIKVRRHRQYLWDQTLVAKTIRYRIQYHALLNMYRVRNESTGAVENFSTLSAALDVMSALRNFHIMKKRAIDPKNINYLEMKIRFDREALPLPLRPTAYLSAQWYLSSDWFVWCLTK